ncbi:MAG: class I SAM-dependent methyltransferase [Rikenellaceae bacterium]
MSKGVVTAERVSRDGSDNFVFQRSILAYHFAAERISGKVLEIGTGSGYGVDVIAPHASKFTTIDKFESAVDLSNHTNVNFIQTNVPPLPFEDESFDCVISFQVIEHIVDDAKFVSEVRRVLKRGGIFIVSTPNILMSLTRNPWHVREYTASELSNLLADAKFSDIEAFGVVGNKKVMEYYEKNREGVRRFTRFDILDLQHRLPRWMLQIPYDILNRLNRKRLLSQNNTLTQSITMEDYNVEPVRDDAFDLLYIAVK